MSKEKWTWKSQTYCQEKGKYLHRVKVLQKWRKLLWCILKLIVVAPFLHLVLLSQHINQEILFQRLIPYILKVILLICRNFTGIIIIQYLNASERQAESSRNNWSTIVSTKPFVETIALLRFSWQAKFPMIPRQISCR